MNFFFLVCLVLQVLGWLGVVIGLLFEPDKDPRFQGDKLIYRS